MPIARRIAPRATLLGVRGRATEEGSNRWFRRAGETGFDQQDIRDEAQALAAFVEGAVVGYGLDPDRLIFLGYSNGANMLGAFILLHPGLVHRALLLRAIQVLEDPPHADITGAKVLVLEGSDDPFRQMAPAVADSLVMSGAQVDVLNFEADHQLAAADVTAAAEWIKLNVTIPRPE